ncbi:Allantoinase [Raoultella planticola]|uniref:Allantoinase n=1 Tax=Raoultella planticola TaxID=575 RepID=A0A485DAY8_RAOPL|nr:Allantoinase [Raoultella planticola]
MIMSPPVRYSPKLRRSARVLYLAKVAGCRLHVCHVSSPEGVAEVTRARQEGQDVTCESCPHYFVLDTEQF